MVIGARALSSASDDAAGAGLQRDLDEISFGAGASGAWALGSRAVLAKALERARRIGMHHGPA